MAQLEGCFLSEKDPSGCSLASYSFENLLCIILDRGMCEALLAG